MLFNLFHNSTKRLSDNPIDMADWPSGWKETQYKVYKGAEVFKLRSDFSKEIAEKKLFKLINNRKTKRGFKNSTITFDEISSILKFSVSERPLVLAGTEGVKSRMYSSAGARYPLEIYILIQKPVTAQNSSKNLEPGLYHYRVADESLERLASSTDIAGLVENSIYVDWAQAAPVVVCITGVFDRMMGKYGLRGYRFLLQEVGFIHALLSMVSDELGLAATPIGGYADDKLEKFMDIDGVSEAILSVCVIGEPKHEK